MDFAETMINEEEKHDCAEKEVTQEAPKKKPHKKRKKLLYETVRRQLEFYFSDANLSRDRLLGRLMKDDPNVPLEVFMKFNKIRALISSVDELAKALKGSEMLEVSEDKQTVRRVTPILTKTNVDECIIYVENVAPDATHEYVSKMFSEYGKVVYVSLPKFHGNVNKGFAFVEFDTPEEAQKALQTFWDKGCCLPTHMPPDKLCSIRSQSLSIDNVDNIPKSFESSAEPKGINSAQPEESHQGEDDDDDKSQEQPDSSTAAREESTPSSEHSTETKSEAEVTKSSKKRKLKDEANVDSSEPEGKKIKKVKLVEDKINLDTDDSTLPENGGSENKKRHRKKKIKTKEDSNEVFSDGLLILSKNEWKRLRNKYLDMQRQKMKEVKSRLYQAHAYYDKWRNDDGSKKKPQRNHEGSNKKAKMNDEGSKGKPEGVGRVKFNPGTIVKVNFEEPVDCAATFKKEAKEHSCVKYVDVAAGESQAYVRCSSAEEAHTLVERQPWRQMHVLEGDEENDYWIKIQNDRHDKINKKCATTRTKERGKKKLLRKAEKMRGTHLVFN